MISFACSSCGKKLSVKDELAGKRVKCPACGKPTLIVALTQTGAQTGAPKAKGSQTIPRDLPSALSVHGTSMTGDAQTVPPPDQADVTQNLPPHPDDEEDKPSLTDFLSPPQRADEIGRLGTYRILKILGHGGMGVVYQAEDPALERLVAIKAMLPSLATSKAAKARFIREAKAAAAIKHDYIVGIYQVGEANGAPFLAMEFLEGEPLDVRLDREKKLPVGEVVRIGRQMAEGLAAAHERDLVHRDIKPANVWLEGKKARVKILDFGLARSMADQSHLTRTGAVVGTPAYMAPEQAGGQSVDHRCDLFSLGCVLYQMATGEKPFKGNDTLSILSALAMHTPPAPRLVNKDVPSELSTLIMRLLAKKPDERPATAQEVAEMLEAMAGPSGSTATMSAIRPKSTAGGKRSWVRCSLKYTLFGCLGLFALGVVIRIMTDDGTLIIDVDDPNVEVLVRMKDVIIKNRTTDREFRIKPGKGDVEVFEKGGVGPLTTKQFTLNHGGKETVKIRMEDVRQATKVAPKVAPKVEPPPMPPTPILESPKFALRFAGQGQYLTNNEVEIPIGGPWTLECWVNPERIDLPVDGALLLCNGEHFFMALLHENTRGMRWIANGAKVRDAGGSDLPVAFGRWTHLALVHDQGALTLFVNGGKQKRPTRITLPDQSTRISVGPSQFTATGNLSGFHGLLREIRVSTRVRYRDEFQPAERFESDKDTVALYHLDEGRGDAFADATGRGNEGKIVGARWVKIEAPSSAPSSSAGAFALGFEGATPSVAINGLALDVRKPFTVEASVRADEPASKNAFVLRGAPLDISLRQDGKWQLWSGNEGVSSLNSDQPAKLGQWTHLAIVNDGKTHTIFVDGRVQRKTAPDRPPSIGYDPGFSLGAVSKPDHRGNEPIHGAIRWLRFSEKARYDKDFVPSLTSTADADTIALYPFDEGQGDTLHDVSGHNRHGKIVGAKWITIQQGLPPLDAAWLSRVAGLAIDKQVEEVNAELKHRNPGFAGDAPYNPERGGGFTVDGDKVFDLTPLKVLTKLKHLGCSGTKEGSRKLADLSPLRGSDLVYLNCSWTDVADLTPLTDLKLVYLNCGNTRVSSLEPLRGMKLDFLACNSTQVTDLTPLTGMKLRYLNFLGTKVKDWSPLKGMPVDEIVFSGDPLDLDVLRSMSKLKTINGKDASQFWQEHKLSGGP
jgi:serine/threonine protein kinase